MQDSLGSQPARYFRPLDSAAVFMSASPRSKSTPTVLSMFIKRQIAFSINPSVPLMLQVTVVRSRSGSKAKPVAQVDAKGFAEIVHEGEDNGQRRRDDDRAHDLMLGRLHGYDADEYDYKNGHSS